MRIVKTVKPGQKGTKEPSGLQRVSYVSDTGTTKTPARVLDTGVYI